MTEPATEDRAHDLAADLVLCEAATEGPWCWIGETWPHRAIGPGRKRSVCRIVPANQRHDGAQTGGAQEVRDANMIAAARSGWPAAIRRALAAEAWKAWVHAWLDGVGVPHDPDPEHTVASGCRISGRLRYLLGRATSAVAAQAEVIARRAESPAHPATDPPPAASPAPE